MANKKTEKTGEAETLLVELLTEELPPKALIHIARKFTETVIEHLVLDRFLTDATFDPEAVLATPRRIAVAIPNVLGIQKDGLLEQKGPPIKAGDAAISKFAEKWGVEVSSLENHNDPKGEYVFLRKVLKGEPIENFLAGIITNAIRKLPIPKTMRWGSGEVQFVRPVHGLVMLHGSRVVPGEVLGIASSNKTLGHRFLSDGVIVLKHADDYGRALEKGKVIVGFAKRRAEIARQLEKTAGGAVLVANDSLLDEIAALVEEPTVYEGRFEPGFLAVPEECLILSMQQHQKYVPLRDKATRKLLPRFLFVSNIPAKDPADIIHGNERVLRARLSDAKFFYDQDRKTRLEARVPRLGSVVYLKKLGSQLDRVERIRKLVARIARDFSPSIGASADRAAYLCKADLLTEMVGEFPELQGIMGRYYALNDGEPKQVADAIGDLYRLRLEDVDPENLASACLYLADRIEQMVGLFSIGERPTGERDPYGLRRAALGVVKVFESLGATTNLGGGSIPDIKDIVESAFGLFSNNQVAQDTVTAVHDFVLDRYWHQLATIYDKNIVEAVLSQKPPLVEVVRRVEAVKKFSGLPEAESLAAATKRARNILRKEKFSNVQLAKSELLVEEAEKDLARAIVDVRGKIDAHFDRRQFVDCLSTLAGMRPKVDTFFDKVLVNAEDPKIRENRLALLSELDYLFNRVADISKLAA